MKKTISLVLTLIMVFSCFSVLTVNALDAGDIANAIYNDETISASKAALSNFKIENLPDNFNCEIRKLPAWTDSDPDNDVNLLGMDLDYLYNCKGSFVWGFFDVYGVDENGVSVMKITTDDIALAVNNLNIYLQRVLYSIYGGIGVFTAENAADITNLIGHILRPGFVSLSEDDFKIIFGNKTPTSNDFYKAISEKSGLAELISYNWIGKETSYYQPVIDALGGNYVEFYSEYYSDGVKLGSKIIEGAIGKITTVGPIEYLLDLITVYCSSYDLVYRNPTLDLFSLKKDAFQSEIPASKLNSFNGLLRLIFCDCDPLGTDGNGTTVKTGCFVDETASVDHFCPLEFPVERFNSAADSTERIIYLYYYFNLCGAYRGNKEVINGLNEKIRSSDKLNDTDKARIVAVIDGFFLGKFVESTIDDAIVPLYKENISTATDSIFERFRNTVMGFLKKIADYFDYLRKLFNGDFIYGDGNSPFN